MRKIEMSAGISRQLRAAAVAAAVAATALTAQAATTANYEFSTRYKGTLQDYATLSVIGGGGSDWQFTLHLLDNFDDIFGHRSFAGALAVNAVTAPDTIAVSDIGGNGVNRVFGGDANGPRGFDFGFDLGHGRDRLTAGESVSWTADFSDFSCQGKGRHTHCFDSPVDVLASGASPFALQIQGLRGHDHRVWAYDTPAPVPEPETYAMMMSGMAAIAAVVRRRRQR
jgi:hypothetical protein